MPRRLLGVVAALLLAAFAQTQTKTYTVREGDSLSVIASRVGVSQASIAKANRLTSIHKLKPGLKLRIPTATRAASAKPAAKKGGYVVRDGDNDWKIAKKLNVTVAQLHTANPGVTWSRIRAGQSLRVPSAKVKAQVAAKYAKRKASGGYVVKSGDNDWNIAKKYSITPSKLRSLNPGVNWKALQLGQHINVPGSKVALAAPASSIRSKHAVISSDKVTVRRGPDVSHSAITTVAQSTPVTVLGKEGSWYKLRFPHGTVGWVRGDFLKSVSSARVASARVAERKASDRFASAPKKVASNATRRSSRTSRKPVSKTEYLAVKATGNNADMMAFAKSMLGTRYRWAGMSRSGTDCSGFSSQVYASVGIKLPRTSREQSTFGKPVAKSALSSGDLVFFRSRGGRRVNHVGVYIGDNKFIHSSSSAGRVVVDDLTGYYSRRFAGARRVRGVVASSSKSSKKPAAVTAKTEPKPKAPKDEVEVSPIDPPPAAEPPKSTKGLDDIGK